jgi:NADH-quinone oxidoreductase subunit J
LTLAPGLVAQGEKLGNAQMVSRGLFAEYLLPFEILSVILLVALVGAVVLAKAERV